MSEEFCDGVKILLKRMESNPEEFKDTSKWEELVNIHHLKDGFWSHVLTPAEVEALRAGLRVIYRELFTTRVMTKLLEDKEEEVTYKVTERYAHGMNDPRMLVSLGGSGGTTSPFQNVYNATSNTSFATKLKQKLSML